MDYKLLTAQMEALCEDCDYEISRLSNVSALIFSEMKDLNWAGFYLFRDGKLILGPFQGKVACTKIAIGKGVCGTAAERDEAVLVYDVHEFPGHIACDCASNSEIVVPIHKDGQLYGVLDIDSPSIGRFTEEDEVGLVYFVEKLEKVLF